MSVVLRLLLALLLLLFMLGLFVQDLGQPALMLAIGLAGGLYILGLVRLWRKAGMGRGIPLWRAVCFLGGLILLAASLSTPLDYQADRAFSIHMIQHMLLMKVIPPLLLLGEFFPVFLWAAGKDTARLAGRTLARFPGLDRLWNRFTSPWVAWSIFTAVLWVWHAPPFFQAALQNEQVHALEHVTFLAASLLFWWFLVKRGRDGAFRYGTAVLYLFATLMQESALGALLTFSTGAWYSHYSTTPNLWGLSPLGDQQLAGMIMWLPLGVLFTFLTLYYFGIWLKEIDKRMNLARPEGLPTGDRHE